MPGIIPDSTLVKFMEIQKEAFKSFAQKTATWYRYKHPVDAFMEDFGQVNQAAFDDPLLYDSITLNVLQNYNYMRTWPIDQPSIAGEVDRQSIQLFFNKEILNDLGYLSVYGNLAYNPDYDRFRLDGILYRPSGDTAAAQNMLSDIFFLLILQREETETTQYTIR